MGSLDAYVYSFEYDFDVIGSIPYSESEIEILKDVMANFVKNEDEKITDILERFLPAY